MVDIELKVNPGKIAMILFTRKRTMHGHKIPNLDCTEVNRAYKLK